MMGMFTLSSPFLFSRNRLALALPLHALNKRTLNATLLTNRIVRKWDWLGHVVAELRGHTDYVYSVAVGAGERGRLLSCGEDHSAVRPFLTLYHI